MKQWEIDLRKKLNDELEDGLYSLEGLTTGKKGYIEFEIAMRKEINKQYEVEGNAITPSTHVLSLGKGVKQLIKECDNKPQYTKLSLDTLNNIIKDLFKTNNMKQINIKIINNSNNPLPKYATMGSAGMDIRAFLPTDTSVVIRPKQGRMIPTGLFMEIPKGYMMDVRPRSGLAYKHSIMVTNTPGTIDSDYRGQCNVLLYNGGDEDFLVSNGDRIAQFVLQECIQANFIEDTLSETDRGEGGFGHTGKD